MLWLCISSDYQHIIVTICDQSNVIETATIDKKNGNKQLMPTIDHVLKKHQVSLPDIAFIGINRGPAPYTTLRTTLATVNGLHQATDIPLVGIDALHTFVDTYAQNNPGKTIIALLNAFNYELFYGISTPDKTVSSGYAPLETICTMIQDAYAQNEVLLIGNGATLYNEQLEKALGRPLRSDIPAYPSTDQLIHAGWHNWQQKQTIETALPLYLKEVAYKSSINVTT